MLIRGRVPRVFSPRVVVLLRSSWGCVCVCGVVCGVVPQSHINQNAPPYAATCGMAFSATRGLESGWMSWLSSPVFAYLIGSPPTPSPPTLYKLEREMNKNGYNYNYSFFLEKKFLDLWKYLITEELPWKNHKSRNNKNSFLFSLIHWELPFFLFLCYFFFGRKTGHPRDFDLFFFVSRSLAATAQVSVFFFIWSPF